MGTPKTFVKPFALLWTKWNAALFKTWLSP